MVFVFLYVTYFTLPNALEVHPCCCVGHYFILFYGNKPFIVENISQLKSERDQKGQKDSAHCYLLGRQKGPWAVGWGQPLEAENNPDYQPTRKWGHQSCSHRELSTTNNLNGLETDSPLEPPERNTVLPRSWFQPCGSWTEKTSQAQWISDLLIGETIKLCCLEPQSLW